MITDEEIQRIIDEEGGNFKPSEFLSGRASLSADLIRHTVRWRNWHGFLCQPTSYFRTSGSHGTGLAGDDLLWLPGQWRKQQPDPMTIWNALTTYPWLGVGIYFDWNDGIGVHKDLIWPPERQRPLRWLRARGTYYYQELSGRFYARHTNTWTTLEEEIEKYEQQRNRD